MYQSKVKDDLPELPSKKIICLSNVSKGYIFGKKKLVTLETIVHSPTGSPPSNRLPFDPATIEHIRICQMSPNDQQISGLHLFSNIKKLEIWDCTINSISEVNLNFPLLVTVRLQEVRGIEKLNLNASKLLNIWVVSCDRLKVFLVNGDSIKTVVTTVLQTVEMEKIKNLKYLYLYGGQMDPSFLSGRDKMKEVHLGDESLVSNLFKQKKQDRPNLKIYLYGCLLNGTDDPIVSCESLEDGLNHYPCQAEHLIRLADNIPFLFELNYSAMARIVCGLEISVFSRFSCLSKVIVDQPIRESNEVERVLKFLKNLPSIYELEFVDQSDESLDWQESGFPRDLTDWWPQELFDRLPDHCAVQDLTIGGKVSNFNFLSRMIDLIELDVDASIGERVISDVLNNCAYLSTFKFRFAAYIVKISIASRRFTVSVEGESRTFTQVEPVINFIVEQVVAN